MNMEKDVSIYIGQNKEDFESYCDENNIDYRILSEDDNHYIVTADLKMNRLNIHLNAGIITSIYLG